MSVLLRRWLPLLLLTLVACWLRTHNLARRPMHADEANQAVKTGELLETGRYVFDPRDHHGPTLYYAALPLAWVRGESTLAELSETTVRLVPAIAGTLSVVLLYALVNSFAGSSRAAARPAGTSQRASTVALVAAAFLAVCPPAVYYSRYFVQETLLATFSLAAFFCARRWQLAGRLSWSIATGAAVGLMLATKASAPLFLVAAALALFVTRPRANAPPSSSTGQKRLVPLLAAALAGITVAAVFYSSFGSHIAGLRDALGAYTQGGERAVGATGHEKPFGYYAALFGWQKSGGLVFHQTGFTLLALVGGAVAVRPWNSQPEQQRFVRASLVYLAIVALTLSLVPYKTPWHVVHLLPAVAVLAAFALEALRPVGLAAAAATAVLFLQASQTRLVAFQRPADARNPYAYVHSAPDVLKVRALTEAARLQFPTAPVRVIGDEYWPLPWYLRGLPQVGYWTSPPKECDGALVIVSEPHADEVRARLRGRYRESLIGLRPGVLCVVFTAVR
ncbi:MAG TPA: flippase activity-associated protein Agl23 [Opitutus sp.]|nr:flippase activity-associated protein Agl23 [Opitutus sp.]